MPLRHRAAPGGSGVSARHVMATTLRRRWDILLVIAAGGAIGTLARWGLAQLQPHAADSFPWSTWLVNITGSLIMGGFVTVLLELSAPHRYLRPFVGVGVLGGYTTFSTYMLETRDLVADSQTATASTYLLGTLVAGLVAVFVGMLVARTALRGLSTRSRTARMRRRERPEGGRDV